jgi:hypothetical protein
MRLGQIGKGHFVLAESARSHDATYVQGAGGTFKNRHYVTFKRSKRYREGLKELMIS